MPDEVNFTDLIALTRIGPDTVVEKFGGMINSSFFDASNILALLKQKGLIDFTTSFPGQSAITVTALGSKVLGDANAGADNEFDQLDLAVLTQLANGKRTIQDLGGTINVRPNDLAMHLYKLGVQQYLSYEFRNGTIMIALTEKGFLQTKGGMPQSATQMQAQQEQPKGAGETQQVPPVATAPAAGTLQAAQAGVAPTPTVDINQLEANIRRSRRRRLFGITALVLVLIVIVLALMLSSMK
jgi:hypothetical protein